MLGLHPFKRLEIRLVIVLSAVLVCVVGAYTVHATHRVDDSGYKRKVYWELSVGHLEASDGWFYSDHHFYVQNDRDERIEVDWEFSHKILEHGATNFDLPDDSTDGSFTLDGLDDAKSGDDLRCYHDDRRSTPYSNLKDGDYYLEAYTRLYIRDHKKKKIDSSKITKTLDRPEE